MFLRGQLDPIQVDGPYIAARCLGYQTQGYAFALFEDRYSEENGLIKECGCTSVARTAFLVENIVIVLDTIVGKGQNNVRNLYIKYSYYSKN